jgi:transposase InsO family protein
MAWKESTVSQQRLVLAHRVVELKHPLAQVAREMGVSRKTGGKWVSRYRADPMASMEDQSRRPHRSPRRTADAVEARVLAWRAESHWGARKIHRLMADEPPCPSIRTISTILRRHGRMDPVASIPEPPATQRFERPAANDLWQMDHKSALEIRRCKFMPLVVIDDHSRYCLLLKLAPDKQVATAFSLLWDLLGEVGLPQAILSDNAFSAPVGLSWMDAQLVRLGIRPLHGRPYHPQTQGKVERLNGTINRELLVDARRDCTENFAADAERWRRRYNTLRPHESLGDQPPAARWQESPRRRPATLPPVEYPRGSTLRKVTQVGDVYYHGRRILVGRSLEKEFVRIQESAGQIELYYAWKLIRVLSYDQLGPARTYKII